MQIVISYLVKDNQNIDCCSFSIKSYMVKLIKYSFNIAKDPVCKMNAVRKLQYI